MCSNVYLTQVLKRNKSFGGVFAYDELETLELPAEKVLSIIVNTEPITSNISGHWVLITFLAATAAQEGHLSLRPSVRYTSLTYALKSFPLQLYSSAFSSSFSFSF